MTKIIGHRGAAGLDLENTLPAFHKAITLGVETLEFDVQATRDGQFVVCHDEHLIRVSSENKLIEELTYEELRAIPLLNGSYVPLLSEVLDLARTHKRAVIVEVKTRRYTEELCQLLDAYTDLDMIVASFLHDVIRDIHRLRPTYRLYLAENHWPIAVLQEARRIGAEGIDLHYMLINPLTYLLAKRWKIAIMLYTVDHPFLVRLISLFYPRVAICTNHPERFITPPSAARARTKKTS